ncbi:putative sulfate exporter family transporter [Desulfotruncus alcoholivorax]|uniref:putative sulfate exporter family transporter n=1 Tax=Desulfotruncus alcoholivorax TaxID=265477 RepID=UPI0009D64DAD
MGKRLSLTSRLASLIGVGIAVCGTLAIAAVAFLVQADDDETTLSVAIIAILGTLETQPIP